MASHTLIGSSLPVAPPPDARVALVRPGAEKARRPRVAGPAAHRTIDLYRAFVARYVDIHRVALRPADWASQARPHPPREPARTAHAEDAAKVDLFRHQIAEADRLDGREAGVLAGLRARVEAARREDDARYRERLAAFHTAYSEWDQTAGFARRVLARQPPALHHVLSLFPPFDGFRALLEDAEVAIGDETPAHVEVRLEVCPLDIFPTERPALVLPEHRLVVEPVLMDETRAQHRAYVSGAVIRAATEVLARLPLPSVRVTATVDAPIVAAEIDREALFALNLPRLDPVETLAAFEPRERWHPMRGFRPLE